MKRTQWKDALRNIAKQKVSWLSVVVIALLGVGSFLSISYAADSMRKNCSAWYAQMRFRNIEVVSTHLITAEDLNALRELEGVRDVEAIWLANGEVYKDGTSQKASFLSLTERINIPLVREGRLPQTETECAVERRLAEEMDWHLGDVIEEYNMIDDTGQFFYGGESMTVTAIVEHPDHLSLNLGETPYLLVLPSLFDHEALQGSCMKAEIQIGELPDANRFSERNSAVSAAMVQRIEALAAERTPLRDAALKEAAYAQIDEYEAVYRDSLAEQLALREALKADPSAAQEDISENESYIAALEENLVNLAEAREEAENIVSRWIVLDDRGSPSYVQLLAGSENLGSLRMTFALMFIVISLLVIYATVSKMVDEQRTLVGTAKALGFQKREILSKYLVYGVSGTLLGTVLGVLLARFWLAGIALKGYGKYISVDISQPSFSVGITLIVLLISILLAAAAVWSACSRLVRTPAVRLMQPPVPKGKTGSENQKKRIFPLYSRLILRNVRSDLRRVVVTVVSVAGCCALLVNGFTLKHGVTGCVEHQYGQIIDYDWEIECWESAVPEIEQILRDAGTESAAVYKTTLITNIEDTGIANLLCGDLKDINKVYHLLDWKTGTPITEAEDGILIQRRLAEIYGLDVGSEFDLSDGLSKLVTVRVAGVFEHYIGLPAVMSAAYYKEVFGKDCQCNTMLVRLNGVDEAALSAQLDENWGVKAYGAPDRASFRSSTYVINSIVALLTTMSAMLAGVVLMNLTNLFFQQKKREMTVMRINGFTAKQTVGYLLREIAVTTAVGIVLGIAVGASMAYYILRALEQSFVQFDRSVSIPAWILGAGITLLFAGIVNWLVLRKIKHLKLTDLS